MLPVVPVGRYVLLAAVAVREMKINTPWFRVHKNCVGER